MPTTDQKKITIRDVALAAGIGKATVSRALSGSGYVSPETRRLVLQTSKKLGYEANPTAQQLAKGRCDQTISIVSLGLDFGVETRKLQLMQQYLMERGFFVPLHVFHPFGSNPVTDQATLLSAVRRQKPRALVCNLGKLSTSAIEELQRYQDEGGVLIGYGNPATLDCDQVLFDEEGNTYRAASYLLALKHREIGLHLHTGSVKSLDHPWIRGFRRALEEHNLPLREEWVFADGHFEDGGVNMAKKFLRMRDCPTGMCIINDVTAQAFVNTLIRAGLRIPENVSVVGYDDVAAARTCIVPLTTVAHPVEEIAKRIVEFVCDRIDGTYDGPPRREVIGGDLVIRKSTATLTV